MQVFSENSKEVSSMEKNLTATFNHVDNLEQAAAELKRQGVLDLKFDQSRSIQVDYQSDHLVQSLIDNSSSDDCYALEVSVELSRYRQAEDTLIKYGGRL